MVSAIDSAAALAADAELKSEGYDPSDDDFYEAIDYKLRNQFPHKYEDAPPPVNIGWDSHKAAVSQETFENNSPYRNA